MDIRGCTDDSTRTFVILWISKRLCARTVRLGLAYHIPREISAAVFNVKIKFERVSALSA